MKSEILALLREQGSYISGQELCERFGVSRTAVWKAVNQLKKEGYRIEAVQNKGYLLVQEDDIFGQNELESRMCTKWAGHPVKFYQEINSTNLQAKLEAEDGAQQGLLIVADKQTAGRGRRGRGWNSPAGTNVYFTLLLKPTYPVEKVSAVTLVMALAVAEAVRTICGVESAIKWPNDIVVDGKKVCGILTEMSMEREYIQHVVIGVGVNVGLQEFEPELAQKATSLQAACGRKVPRAALVVEIMKSFEKYYEIFCKTLDLSGLREPYQAHLANLDKEVRVLDPKGEFTGIARGIDDAGELLVELADKTLVKVYAGEVSVRGIYGYV